MYLMTSNSTPRYIAKGNENYAHIQFVHKVFMVALFITANK